MKMQEWETQVNRLGEEGIPFLFMVDFEMKRPFVKALNEIDATTLQFNFNGLSNEHNSNSGKQASCTTFTKTPVSINDYTKSFNLVQKHLLYGNSFLVNLTMPTPIQTNLSLQDVFQVSKQPFRLWLKDEFVVFSPERFVRMKDRYIESFPMKGTIDASIENAEHNILHNKKEMAEHATIVDLIRNDLSIVSHNVRVSRYRYIDKINTNQKDLLQVSSEIRGELPQGWQANMGSIIRQLLPAGSISGAPKDKTVEIIQEAEPDQRGFYTGVMGIFDGHMLDSAVMIRFIEQTSQGLVFRSGGGITAQSQVEEEYQELIDKIYLPV